MCPGEKPLVLFDEAAAEPRARYTLATYATKASAYITARCRKNQSLISMRGQTARTNLPLQRGQPHLNGNSAPPPPPREKKTVNNKNENDNRSSGQRIALAGSESGQDKKTAAHCSLPSERNPNKPAWPQAHGYTNKRGEVHSLKLENTP